jgi:arylsulfatase A-like enzyme
VAKNLVLFQLLVAILLASCSKTEKPNIILIMADDLGYNDIGCFGSSLADTPNLDRLAKSGKVFVDFHSNGAICSPTRAALMTGRYQQRAGIEAVISAANHRHTGLSPREYSLPRHLKSHGYRTGIVGKWHLGYDTAFSPIESGFEFFKGYVSGNIDYHSHIDQTGIHDWWLGKNKIVEDGYSTDLITETSVEFIRENRDRPFFLYLWRHFGNCPERNWLKKPNSCTAKVSRSTLAFGTIPTGNGSTGNYSMFPPSCSRSMEDMPPGLTGNMTAGGLFGPIGLRIRNCWI